jgi:hypothetical protein
MPRYNRAFIIILMLLVASLHFVTGPHYKGPFPHFVNGYLIDLLLPFALYFLLCMYDKYVFKYWPVRCCAIFLLGVTIETAQYYGVPIFGSTFDPLDYVAYALGVLLAAFLDQIVIPKYFAMLINKRLPEYRK